MRLIKIILTLVIQPAQTVDDPWRREMGINGVYKLKCFVPGEVHAVYLVEYPVEIGGMVRRKGGLPITCHQQYHHNDGEAPFFGEDIRA
jgi:hypothetical protein